MVHILANEFLEEKIAHIKVVTIVLILIFSKQISKKDIN